MLSSSAWQSLGEVNYRKWVIYEFDHELQGLGSSRVCTALSHCAGPIALYCISRGGKEEVEASEEPPFTNVDPVPDGSGRIVTLSGQTLGLVEFGKEPLAPGGFGWLEAHDGYSDEVVVVVRTGGKVLVVNALGEVVGAFSLAAHVGGSGIAQVCMFRDGFVVVLADGRVFNVGGIRIGSNGCCDGAMEEREGGFRVKFWNEGNSVLEDVLVNRKEHEAQNVGSIRFTAFAVSSKTLFVALSNRDVVVVDEFSAVHYQPGNLSSSIVRMAVAPNDRFIACFTSAGLLVVYNTAFSKRVLEFDTKTELAPLAMQWCGDDSVVMYWKGLGLLMVGPYGDWIKYTYGEGLCILQEVDCLRIVTRDKVEILQRVPATTDAICRIGSFAPAAMLVDAMEAVNAGDPKANDSIEAIREEDALSSSVAECIEAACGEFGVEQQKFLLQVAAFGKRFCQDTAEHQKLGVKLAEACMQLRVLNILRHESVGMPLTTAQLVKLSPLGVVRRLVVRNQHFLAKRLCEYLDLDLKTRRFVVEDWACKKIRRSVKAEEDDEQQQHQQKVKADQTATSLASGIAGLERVDARLMQSVHKMFSSVRRCSFAKVGLLAFRLDKKKLGVGLIQLETVLPRRVTALIEIEHWTLALQSALESKDANLMFLAVFSLFIRRKDTGELSRFYSEVKAYPELYLQLLHYFATSKSRTVKNSLLQLGKLKEAAQENLKASFEADEVGIKLTQLQKAKDLYKNNKQYALHEELVAKQMKLVRVQRELEELTGENCFVGLSLVDTVHNCIILGLLTQAEAVRSKFRVGDKAFYHVKVKALSQLQSWTELRNFASSMKPPIGYEYFAAACIERGNLTEAEYYVNLIKSDEEKLNILMDLEKWEEACALVLKLEDVALAISLTGRCKDPAVIEAVNAKFR